MGYASTLMMGDVERRVNQWIERFLIPKSYSNPISILKIMPCKEIMDYDMNIFTGIHLPAFPMDNPHCAIIVKDRKFNNL